MSTQRIAFKLTACGIAGAMLLVGTASAGAPQYSITELGTLGGRWSSGKAINARGQIAGSSQTESGDTHAFLYSRRMLVDLGTLGGTQSNALALNNRGQVVGYSTIDSQNPTSPSFLYSHGQMVDLSEALGSDRTGVMAINDRGQLTGTPLFLYTDGKIQYLGNPIGRGQSVGYGINSHGDIVGYAEVGPGVSAFLYTDGTMHNLTLSGSSWQRVCPGGSSTGYAINDKRQVTGICLWGRDSGRAFLYSDGVVQDLGTLEKRLGWLKRAGLAINNCGDVTGFSWILGPRRFQSRAFLYTDGTMYDLNDLLDPEDVRSSQVNLTEATGINDAGWIVANGKDGAYLLRPEGKGGRENHHACSRPESPDPEDEGAEAKNE